MKGFYERLERIRKIQNLHSQNMNVAEIAMYLGITERVVKEDLKCGDLLSKFILEDWVRFSQQEKGVERLLSEAKKKPEEKN